MCGIAGILSLNSLTENIDSRNEEMVSALNKGLDSIKHRGPDSRKIVRFDKIVLGHVRLKIIDLSNESNQPFISNCGRYTIVFNGEIYNYLELRKQWGKEYEFKTNSDTEVLLAGFVLQGADVLQSLNGMFAFAIWDNQKQELFLARDRFGVKPLYYAETSQEFLFSSEVKGIHATGLIEKKTNIQTWSSYLLDGIYDHNEETFFEGICSIKPGHYLIVNQQEKSLKFECWFHLTNRITIEERKSTDIEEELLFLLEDSIHLRFRADVPVGVCLSGGLDSSLLLALIHRVKGTDFPLHAFTFYTNDQRYDELPWVQQVLRNTQVIHHACLVSPEIVKSRAENLQYTMDGPYGGVPTIAMNRVFEEASSLGIKVLLDGNGMDEAWGGYEYYQRLDEINLGLGPVQGSKSSVNLREVVSSNVLSNYSPWVVPKYHDDKLTNAQMLDLYHRKIPRAMRFADRNSMSYSIELREPFLDYRLIELGLSQPIQNKVFSGKGKYLVRQLAAKIIPQGVVEAPKRPVQTPQREWLKDDLYSWFSEKEFNNKHAFFDDLEFNQIVKDYKIKDYDNSNFIWQLLSCKF
jgi:asparagine synthase (glutamine-hydrolysing)